MRIGDVLNGRPVTQPFSAFLRTAALERADQAEQGVVGALEVFADFVKKRPIELYLPAGFGKLSRRRMWDQAELGFGLGQHNHRFDPAGGERGIVEERAQFERRPRISIDG